MRSSSTDRSDGSRLAELDQLDFSERQLERWLWSLAALGIGLRVLVYLLRFPLFTDEAKLATSLLDRGYAGLLEPLAYQQIAPFLFMWIQKTATVVFGFSEYSLRLVPVLAACASVLLMRHVSRRLFPGMPGVFALALFAVSYYPVRHGAELKPYATDLLASLVLTALAVEWLVRSPGGGQTEQRPRGGQTEQRPRGGQTEHHRSRWLWLLAAAGPVAVAVSYTAVFTAAGILAALLIPVWRRRDWRSILAWAAGALLAGSTFALNFFLVANRHYELRAAAKLPMVGGFPPPGDPLGALGWLLQAHTGRTFGYPLGGDDGGSLLTFAAFVAGAIVLSRAGRRHQLAVLLAPFALGMTAAILQRYPYGGSGRVTQYLVPAICLLAGLGAARLTTLARRPATRRRAQRVVLAVLLVFGVLLGVSTVLRPYRDRPDMAGRDFARWFWDVKSRDAELVSAWEDLGLEVARPPDQWAPGGAAYRINQRIYSPRHRRGDGPDLASVSHRRPLRVVFLGSALSKRRDALQEWSREMQTRYELAGREWHRLGGYREQHGREDWLELYTFVPLQGMGSPHPDPLPQGERGPESDRQRGDWAPSLELPLGTVDHADCDAIVGWARDPDTALPTLVEVYKIGVSEPVAAVRADLLRADLPSPGKHHGFHLPTPGVLKTGKAESFEVLVYDLGAGGNSVASRQPLARSQQTLTCDAVAGDDAGP